MLCARVGIVVAMGRPSRATRTALAVGGWLAAACVALVVGLVAVSALGRGILAPGPPMIEPGEVEAELAHPPPPADPGLGPGGRGNGEPRARHVERTPGGTVVTGCDGAGQVSLLSWSPAQGFEVDDVQNEPDEDVQITFASEERDVDVTVVCRNGQPRASVQIDD